MRRYAPRVVGALLLAGLLAVVGPAGQQAVADGAAHRTVGAVTDTGDPEPIDMAIAVDESGSLHDTDVLREQDAAQRIAVGEISARSQLTVLGFASADNRQQAPVDEVCPTTTLDPVAREKIGDCIGKLAKRGKGQGTGTDFPSAIRQAVDRLKEGSAKTRVLFLMTDGKLDVSDSPAYGVTRDDRLHNGPIELTEALGEARDAGVEIWPLGFGSQIDTAALKVMAAGGYQGSCVQLPQARPHAATVPDAETLGSTLQAIFAGARCLVTDPPKHGTPPTDITLRISPLATLASIVVSKGDKAVTVTYFDPQGKQVVPGQDADGSTFALSGTGQEVEALRITNPRPGPWRVHLDAPAGHRDQLASVGVQWRGALRSSITLSPTSPRAGESAVVELRLQTRNDEPITDPRDLDRLRVSAELTGAGFPDEPVTLADDGQRPDVKAGDGRFTGTATIPAQATGSLNVVGVLGAIGFDADHRPFATHIAGVNPEVRADVQVSDATVHPGGGTDVVVKAVNNSSTARTLHLDVADAEPGDLTVSPTRITLAPGQSVMTQGRLTAGHGRSHQLAGKVEVTDPAEPGTILDAQLVTLRVVPVPSAPSRLWHSFWWAIVLGLLLLVCFVGYLVWAYAERKRSTDPTGLVLRLLIQDASGPQPGSTLIVNARGEPWYRFDIADETSDDPRLEPRATGRYQLRREPSSGGVLLRAPGRTEERIRIGGSVPIVGSPVELRIDAGGSGGKQRGGGLLPGLVRQLDRFNRRPATPRRPTRPAEPEDAEIPTAGTGSTYYPDL